MSLYCLAERLADPTRRIEALADWVRASPRMTDRYVAAELKAAWDREAKRTAAQGP